MRWLRIIAGFLMHRLRAGGHPKASLLTENEVAPEFHLSDESGRFHRLSDYRGSKIVLWFFVRARTPG